MNQRIATLFVDGSNTVHQMIDGDPSNHANPRRRNEELHGFQDVRERHGRYNQPGPGPPARCPPAAKAVQISFLPSFSAAAGRWGRSTRSAAFPEVLSPCAGMTGQRKPSHLADMNARNAPAALVSPRRVARSPVRCWDDVQSEHSMNILRAKSALAVKPSRPERIDGNRQYVRRHHNVADRNTKTGRPYTEKLHSRLRRRHQFPAGAARRGAPPVGLQRLHGGTAFHSLLVTAISLVLVSIVRPVLTPMRSFLTSDFFQNNITRRFSSTFPTPKICSAGASAV